MTEQKKMKIEFAPGCFDNFDGTQEELDELVTKIQEMFDSGEAQVKAIPLDELLDELSDEELEEIFEQLPDEYDGPKTLH